MIKTTTKAEQRKLDAELDEALAYTFPASDPISVGHPTATEPPGRPVDRRPPVSQQDQLAEARKRRRQSG